MQKKFERQIDAKQVEIEALKGSPESKKKIREYRDAYLYGVNTGQRELMAAADKLHSPESKAYLSSASSEIIGHLTKIANKGRTIIKAHEKAKKGEKPKIIPSLAGLSTNLKGELSQIKEAVESFRILEELETKDIKAVEKANDKLNSSPGSTDPMEIFKGKDELLNKLTSLEPKFISHGKSRSYAKKVMDKYKKLNKKIVDEKSELATGPTARHMAMQDFLKGVDVYANLIEEAKSNPSVGAIEKVKAQAAAVDPAKAYKESLDGRDKGTFAYVDNMYKHLEAQHAETKTKYEGLKEDFDEAEKEALTKSAEKMLGDIESAEKEKLAPLWEKYEPLSKRMDLAGKELESYETTEKGLMATYLILKMTMSPFANQETQFKLQGDVDKRVQAKIKAIDAKIRQIEVNRETRMSMASLGEVGANVFTYVTFLGEEKDGKIYVFNDAYDSLSDDKKQKVRMAVESIIARDKAAVKRETQQAMVELAKSSDNFDKISEVLGDKAKKYAEGLKLFAAGKHKEAVAALEAYVGQSFTKEEQELQAVAIADAKEKISLWKYSGDFYDGIAKYKEGDINVAAKLLKAYVEFAEGTGAEIHKEQISKARDILHLIGMEKVKQLDTLLSDVKLWKNRQLQDRYGQGLEVDKKFWDEGKVVTIKQKVDFKIEGPEMDIIVLGIQDLRKKVEKGELIDFDKEFKKLKAGVHVYLQKTALHPEDNVIDKLSELYEGVNSTDPEVRKATCIKFAKELRKYRAYGRAREYLDKALKPAYKRIIDSGKVSQEEIMQQMMGNSMVMGNVKKAAAAYLKQFKKENPDIPEEQLRQRAEQIVFNMWLKKRYTRELRNHMTSTGEGYEELMLYNEWSPYEEDKDSIWYKPWNYEYYTAEEWDEFKDAAKQNIAMTLATLPIGFGAGAVGANVGKLALRGIASRLLVRTGAAGAEAAIVAIEQGGVQAVRFGSQAWKALTPQLQRAVILARLGAGALSITAEGTFLLGGSQVAEGIITGHMSPITSANLVESIFKAAAFRGIGLGGNKIFARAMATGGKKGAAALVGMESMSGIAGTGVEAASLYAAGHGEYVDTSLILRALLENALTSTGIHAGHKMAAPRIRKAALKEVPVAAKVKKVAAKEVSKAPKAKEAEVSVPIPLKAKRKKVDVEADTIPGALPPKKAAAEKAPVPSEIPITKKAVPHKGPKARKVLVEDVTAAPEGKKPPSEKPPVSAHADTERFIAPSEAPITKKAVAPKAKKAKKVDIKDVTAPPETPKPPVSVDGPTIYSDRPPASVVPPHERPSVRVSQIDTAPGAPQVKRLEKLRAAKNEQLLNDGLANKPDRRELIDRVIRKKEITDQHIANLTEAEIHLLTESDPSYLNKTVVEKIIKGQSDVIKDVLDPRTGKKTKVRIYTDDSTPVGAGGLGQNHECYFVVEGESGVPTSTRLRKGVVKKEHSTLSGKMEHITQREVDTLRTIRDLSDRTGLLEPLYVGQTDTGETLIITKKINPLKGEAETSLAGRQFEDGSAMWERLPPEDTFKYMSQAIVGLRKLHALGRFHADVKPGNIFVGLVDGKPTAVIGDLPTVPASDLRTIKVTLQKNPKISEKGLHTHLWETSGFSIPTSPHYMDGAYIHARCATEWAKAHPNKKVPVHITSLIDMAQTSQMLHDMSAHLRTEEGSRSLPKEARDAVPDALDNLVAKIDDVPDMDKLNADIKAAEESKDSSAVEKAKAAKKEALDGLGDRITMADVQAELQALETIINRRRKSRPTMVSPS